MRGKSGNFCFYVDGEKREKHWYFEPGSLPNVINYLEVNAVHPDFVVTMQEYNPPLPADLIGFLDDMVKFAHTEDQIDALMKAALVYYQFETIYSFNTGNGLVARLLPNSILVQEGILSRPLLSLSNYFYQYHDECAEKFMHIQGQVFDFNILRWI